MDSKAILMPPKERGESTGILLLKKEGSYQADLVLACGSLSQPETIARELYAALGGLLIKKALVTLQQKVFQTGIGRAIMNRLLKAAGHEQVRV